MFSQFPNSIVTNARLCNLTGSGKSNMVATKCCAIAQEVGNPTWRPRNRKYLYICLQTRQKGGFNGKTDVLGFP